MLGKFRQQNLWFTNNVNEVEIATRIVSRNFNRQHKLYNLLHINSWSRRPTTVPAGSDHYFYTECPYVRPKISKSGDNHCRPGLWAGREDHWWLLSCFKNVWIFTHTKICSLENSKWNKALIKLISPEKMRT